MRTLPEAIKWVHAHPTRRGIGPFRVGYGWSWSQLCVALVFDASGGTHTYANANAARAASDLIPGSASDRTPPAGSFVWFDYGRFGHVAFSDGRRLYMASRFADNLGTALGTLTVAQYERVAGARCLGYSWDFGGQRFAGINTSSVGATHVLTAPKPEEEMIMRFKTKNWYITDLFTSVESISQDEAIAINDGCGGGGFEPVTSDHAKLIIAGVKRRRLAALAGQSQAVIDGVAKQLDALVTNEQGFTAADVADEIAKRLTQ